MADFVFDKLSGTLTGRGKTWSALSGGGRYASLASKTYHVPPHALMSGTKRGTQAAFDAKYAQAPFKDKFGFGWFLWLGEANLGIHPDGNVPGTEGCIGITNPDTQDLFSVFETLNAHGFTVEVK